MGRQQPTRKSQQPISRSQQPTETNRQPTIKSQQPTGKSQQPTGAMIIGSVRRRTSKKTYGRQHIIFNDTNFEVQGDAFGDKRSEVKRRKTNAYNVFRAELRENGDPARSHRAPRGGLAGLFQGGPAGSESGWTCANRAWAVGRSTMSRFVTDRRADCARAMG